MTCRVCGHVRPDRRDLATRCDDCLRRGARRLWFLAAGAALIVTAGDIGFGSERGWSVGLTLAVALIVGLPLSVIIHEGAHALAAVLGGMRLDRVVIGSGPLLGSVTVGLVSLELRKYQGIGSTWAGTIDVTRYRGQWTAFYVAAPATSAVAAIICFVIGMAGMLAALWMLFSMLNALMAIVTFRPGRGFGGTVSSDLADLRDIRARSSGDIEEDVASTAMDWMVRDAGAGRLDAAVATARRFVAQYPDSVYRDYFTQSIDELLEGTFDTE